MRDTEKTLMQYLGGNVITLHGKQITLDFESEITSMSFWINEIIEKENKVHGEINSYAKQTLHLHIIKALIFRSTDEGTLMLESTVHPPPESSDKKTTVNSPSENSWVKPKKVFRKKEKKTEPKAPQQDKQKPFNSAKKAKPPVAKWSYQWPRGKTFWYRVSDDTLDKDRMIEFIKILSNNCKIENWVPISGKYSGVKFATVNTWLPSAEIHACNLTWKYWRPSMIGKQLIISRVPKELRHQTNIDVIIKEAIEDNGFKLNNNLTVINLKKKTSTGLLETTFIKISGIDDSIINHLLRKGFLSLNNRAFSLRLFVAK